jgi:hypothetical protein
VGRSKGGSVMKIKGKLLDFDRVDSLDYKFTSVSVRYPEELPIIWECKTDDVLGTAKVIRTETGLEAEGNLTNEVLEDLIIHGAVPSIGWGGFYKILKSHNLEGQFIRVIDSADLKYVCITPKPVFKDYTFEVVKEE